MTHVVTQILDRLQVLAAVPSVGERVRRSARPFEGSAPGIAIRLEDWQVISQASGVKMTAEAEVAFYISAGEINPDDVDATLLKVDAELHEALMADHKIGLAFVQDIDRINFPTDANAEGNVPTGSAISRWRIQFSFDRSSVER